jgi:replication factor C subunit 3/5
LNSLAESNDFPHILFYGQNGAGKRTRIQALLRALFGERVEKVKAEQKTIKIPNKTTTLTVSTISSAFHIEMNPSECGNKDRFVVQEVIKEIAQSRPIETQSTQKPFKVVVLNQVGELTQEAQAGLRRTMEKYMTTCRLILCTNSLTKVIPALRSRCLCIRISAPTMPEVQKILLDIASKEKMELAPQFAVQIARRSNRNVRRAILMLQTCYVEDYPFKAPFKQSSIPLPDWEVFIGKVATLMTAEQSPKQLLMIRTKFYELLVHCIPAETIIKKLALALLELVDNSLKHEVIQWAAFYEHRIHLGSKEIFHLEAFAAKFMALYKNFILRQH